MAANKKNVLFSGGKLISILPSTGDKEGIMLTKNSDKSWTINIVAKISADEAEKVIFKFSDLKKRTGESIEESNPNMPYLTAMDENGKPVFAKLTDNSTLTPTYYRDQFGTITIKLNVTNFGKTQNPKTQNAAGGQ
ncbi:MAG TPA: hypothetical protein VK484_13475 [Ferruginibacter sp.]|nr:hypothetical protein [Ferruginibacter sp.]